MSIDVSEELSLPSSLVSYDYRLLIDGFYLGYSSSLRMETYVPHKLRLTFIGLYGFMSQKIEFFGTTAERTSYQTYCTDFSFKDILKILSSFA
jgi:hypothetical protein